MSAPSWSATDDNPARAAIWRKLGEPDRAVRVLDRLPVKANRPPAATVVILATAKFEAAPLAELFKRKSPREPFAP